MRIDFEQLFQQSLNPYMLLIANEIAKSHGGSIDVQSTAADGTRFRVRLPKKPPAAR